jgi:predicted HAD superfamily Cof-like phosphohydrolase
MESEIMTLVKAMHKKFGLENLTGPTYLGIDEKQFRVAALKEELEEYERASDLVDEYDALLDMIVFAVGTLDRQGLPLLEGFKHVMDANMAKELGQNGNKRGGFKRDLVKPAGWQSPEPKLCRIINALTEPKQLEMFPIDMVEPGADGDIVPGFAPKFDSNKTRVDLLPVGPMSDIASVFGFGAKKYFANSYRQGETVAWSRTYGSILRHLYAFWSGEDNDPESGLPHLAHAGTQLMILMEHTKHNTNKDDRFKR